MAQFSDGPVQWPWCIQLVHGVHSSRFSHWCPAVVPGTRINVTPQGGQKWERVSNSNCRKARKSQGMTLDGQPSATNPNHRHQHHHLEAFTSTSTRSSHLSSFLPPFSFPSCPLLLSSSHRSKESKGSQTWSSMSI